MTTNTGNKQLAVRLEKEVLVAIDKKRMEIAQVEGIIQLAQTLWELL